MSQYNNLNSRPIQQREQQQQSPPQLIQPPQYHDNNIHNPYATSSFKQQQPQPQYNVPPNTTPLHQPQQILRQPSSSTTQLPPPLTSPSSMSNLHSISSIPHHDEMITSNLGIPFAEICFAQSDKTDIQALYDALAFHAQFNLNCAPIGYSPEPTQDSYELFSPQSLPPQPHSFHFHSSSSSKHSLSASTISTTSETSASLWSRFVSSFLPITVYNSQHVLSTDDVHLCGYILPMHLTKLHAYSNVNYIYIHYLMTMMSILKQQQSCYEQHMNYKHTIYLSNLLQQRHLHSTNQLTDMTVSNTNITQLDQQQHHNNNDSEKDNSNIVIVTSSHSNSSSVLHQPSTVLSIENNPTLLTNTTQQSPPNQHQIQQQHKQNKSLSQSTPIIDPNHPLNENFNHSTTSLMSSGASTVGSDTFNPTPSLKIQQQTPYIPFLPLLTTSNGVILANEIFLFNYGSVPKRIHFPFLHEFLRGFAPSLEFKDTNDIVQRFKQQFLRAIPPSFFSTPHTLTSSPPHINDSQLPIQSLTLLHEGPTVVDVDGDHNRKSIVPTTTTTNTTTKTKPPLLPPPSLDLQTSWDTLGGSTVDLFNDNINNNNNNQVVTTPSSRNPTVPSRPSHNMTNNNNNSIAVNSPPPTGLLTQNTNNPTLPPRHPHHQQHHHTHNNNNNNNNTTQPPPPGQLPAAQPTPRHSKKEKVTASVNNLLQRLNPRYYQAVSQPHSPFSQPHTPNTVIDSNSNNNNNNNNTNTPNSGLMNPSQHFATTQNDLDEQLRWFTNCAWNLYHRQSELINNFLRTNLTWVTYRAEIPVPLTMVTFKRILQTYNQFIVDRQIPHCPHCKHLIEKQNKPLEIPQLTPNNSNSSTNGLTTSLTNSGDDNAISNTTPNQSHNKPIIRTRPPPNMIQMPELYEILSKQLQYSTQLQPGSANPLLSTNGNNSFQSIVNSQNNNNNNSMVVVTDLGHGQSGFQAYANLLPPPSSSTSTSSSKLQTLALTSDSGWGCMLRSAQMLLSTTLLFHFSRNDVLSQNPIVHLHNTSLARHITNCPSLHEPYTNAQQLFTTTHHTPTSLLSSFYTPPTPFAFPAENLRTSLQLLIRDSLNGAYSIHAMLLHRADGRTPGQWYSPSEVSFMIYKIVQTARGDHAIPCTYKHMCGLYEQYNYYTYHGLPLPENYQPLYQSANGTWTKFEDRNDPKYHGGGDSGEIHHHNANHTVPNNPLPLETARYKLAGNGSKPFVPSRRRYGVYTTIKKNSNYSQSSPSSSSSSTPDQQRNKGKNATTKLAVNTSTPSQSQSNSSGNLMSTINSTQEYEPRVNLNNLEKIHQRSQFCQARYPLTVGIRQLAVCVCNDGEVYYHSILRRMLSLGTVTPTLVLINVCLGLNHIEPRHYQMFLSMFKLCYNVGAFGGVKNSSLYFYGCQGERVFYLDPHTTQKAIQDSYPVPEGEKNTYTFTQLQSVHIKEIDPALTFGFYLSHVQALSLWFTALKDLLSSSIPNNQYSVNFQIAMDSYNKGDQDDMDDYNTNNYSDDELLSSSNPLNPNNLSTSGSNSSTQFGPQNHHNFSTTSSSSSSSSSSYGSNKQTSTKTGSVSVSNLGPNNSHKQHQLPPLFQENRFYLTGIDPTIKSLSPTPRNNKKRSHEQDLQSQTQPAHDLSKSKFYRQLYENYQQFGVFNEKNNPTTPANSSDLQAQFCTLGIDRPIWANRVDDESDLDEWEEMEEEYGRKGGNGDDDDGDDDFSDFGDSQDDEEDHIDFEDDRHSPEISDDGEDFGEASDYVSDDDDNVIEHNADHHYDDDNNGDGNIPTSRVATTTATITTLSTNSQNSNIVSTNNSMNNSNTTYSSDEDVVSINGPDIPNDYGPTTSSNSKKQNTKIAKIFNKGTLQGQKLTKLLFGEAQTAQIFEPEDNSNSKHDHITSGEATPQLVNRDDFMTSHSEINALKLTDFTTLEDTVDLADFAASDDEEDGMKGMMTPIQSKSPAPPDKAIPLETSNKISNHTPHSRLVEQHHRHESKNTTPRNSNNNSKKSSVVFDNDDDDDDGWDDDIASMLPRTSSNMTPRLSQSNSMNRRHSKGHHGDVGNNGKGLRVANAVSMDGIEQSPSQKRQQQQHLSSPPQSSNSSMPIVTNTNLQNQPSPVNTQQLYTKNGKSDHDMSQSSHTSRNNNRISGLFDDHDGGFDDHLYDEVINYNKRINPTPSSSNNINNNNNNNNNNKAQQPILTSKSKPTHPALQPTRVHPLDQPMNPLPSSQQPHHHHHPQQQPLPNSLLKASVKADFFPTPPIRSQRLVESDDDDSEYELL